ncbi:unnamed protein product [Cyprideis torosa]|uniref:diacylglycerol cholinephosphotransferase n=1 Tax=Cyprideis torosa TaxID=163714 RepID=A0A7R8W7N1_9CRUS|nr:unnamed protein product [Cyprideis torosa]CAG0887722.1 unnamed protein product [Cyprideis torosa]
MDPRWPSYSSSHYIQAAAASSPYNVAPTYQVQQGGAYNAQITPAVQIPSWPGVGQSLLQVPNKSYDLNGSLTSGNVAYISAYQQSSNLQQASVTYSQAAGGYVVSAPKLLNAQAVISTSDTSSYQSSSPSPYTTPPPSSSSNANHQSNRRATASGSTSRSDALDSLSSLLPRVSESSRRGVSHQSPSLAWPLSTATEPRALDYSATSALGQSHQPHQSSGAAEVSVIYRPTPQTLPKFHQQQPDSQPQRPQPVPTPSRRRKSQQPQQIQHLSSTPQPPQHQTFHQLQPLAASSISNHASSSSTSNQKSSNRSSHGSSRRSDHLSSPSMADLSSPVHRLMSSQVGSSPKKSSSSIAHLQPSQQIHHPPLQHHSTIFQDNSAASLTSDSSTFGLACEIEAFTNATFSSASTSAAANNSSTANEEMSPPSLTPLLPCTFPPSHSSASTASPSSNFSASLAAVLHASQQAAAAAAYQHQQQHYQQQNPSAAHHHPSFLPPAAHFAQHHSLAAAAAASVAHQGGHSPAASQPQPPAQEEVDPELKDLIEEASMVYPSAAEMGGPGNGEEDDKKDDKKQASGPGYLDSFEKFITGGSASKEPAAPVQKPPPKPYIPPPSLPRPPPRRRLDDDDDDDFGGRRGFGYSSSKKRSYSSSGMNRGSSFRGRGGSGAASSKPKPKKRKSGDGDDDVKFTSDDMGDESLPRRASSRNKAKEAVSNMKKYADHGSDEEPDIQDSENEEDPEWGPGARHDDSDPDDFRRGGKKKVKRPSSVGSSGSGSGASGPKVNRVAPMPQVGDPSNSTKAFRSASDSLLDVDTTGGEFQTGSFVVLKSDLKDLTFPIWKVEGKFLLHRFEAAPENPAMFKACQSYTSWANDSRNKYHPVPVNRQSATQVVLEDSSAFKFFAESFAKTKGLQESFEVYVQSLISQALDSNFLREIYADNDDYFLPRIAAVEAQSQSRADAILAEVSWPLHVVTSIRAWPGVNITFQQHSSSETEPTLCVCGAPKSQFLAQMYGQTYDRTTLQGIVATEDLQKHKSFKVCRDCKPKLRLFSTLVHQKYNLYVRCATRVSRAKSDDSSKDTTQILNDLLAEDVWLSALFTETQFEWALGILSVSCLAGQAVHGLFGHVARSPAGYVFLLTHSVLVSMMSHQRGGSYDAVILRPQQLKKLTEHTYKCQNSSLMDPVMQPFWNWLVLQVPLWLAPNLITILGLSVNISAAVLLLFFSPDCKQEVPWWACLLNALGLFLYQSLDAIDGKQARRTGTSSPLGELFDHGCDALSSVFVVLSTCVATGMGTIPNWMLFECLSTMVLFYMSHWQTYVSGSLRFGWFDVTEAQFSVILVNIISAVLGVGFWSTPLPIPGIHVPLKVLIIVTGLISAIGFLVGNLGTILSGGVGKNGSTVAMLDMPVNQSFVYFLAAFATLSFYSYLRVILTEGAGKNGSTVAGTSVLGPVIPIALVIIPCIMINSKSVHGIFYENPCVYVLAFGALFCKVTIKLVVASMTKSELNNFDSCMIGPLMIFLNQYFNFFLREDLVLWICLLWCWIDLLRYCGRVCIEICDHFDISLFTIPYPPPSAAAPPAGVKTRSKKSQKSSSKLD